MSFANTSTPNKPTGKAKWQIPKRGIGYCLEGELKEKFCKLFPIHSNRRMMQWFGISFATLQRFKRDLGLSKDMKAIRKELAKDVKKICTDNGYYDSLRGKSPSEACIEGARKKRATGFNPYQELKKKNPRKYKRVMQKKSEARKETYRKEYMRVVYLLPRKTKLRLRNISRAASMQKYVMIHKKNYFPDPDHSDVVCYDKDTDRSSRMESTAIRHGLKIVEGE